ncbi:hypothetical protein TNCV_4922231 [Trichonephila clavipes]|nr:hypothetical protein TNCV_4922231 [Trichonephila clavipes]
MTRRPRARDHGHKATTAEPIGKILYKSKPQVNNSDLELWVTINVLRSPVAEWLVHRACTPQVRGSNPGLGKFHAEIVELEIGAVAIYSPFGEFLRAKSYCHLYGAQGQRQVYF